tara:strand:- start:318 stop:509 length:192 start_codon:yes stop_codon:yes gene_type:complete
MQTKQEIKLTEDEAKLVCAIIDISSKRGAFGGSEMGNVGMLFNKLTQELSKLTKDRTDGADKK